MTQPDTGVINEYRVVETFTKIGLIGSSAVLSSTKKTLVSEAIYLGASGTIQIVSATVLAHSRGQPDQGSIGATLMATIPPQQFIAGFYGQGGSLVGTITGTAIATIQATFLLRGT